MDTFENIFEQVNEDLMERYSLPRTFFEDREKLVPKRSRHSRTQWLRPYIRRMMKYIHAHQLRSVYDQYTILRLDNRLHVLLDESGYDRVEDTISEYITWLADQISTTKRYSEFYSALYDKLDEFKKYSGMDEEPDVTRVDEYMEKYPRFNWKLSTSDWFDSMSDEETINLINRFKCLIELLESL